jgi:hypothetical protein
MILPIADKYVSDANVDAYVCDWKTLEKAKSYEFIIGFYDKNGTTKLGCETLGINQESVASIEEIIQTATNVVNIMSKREDYNIVSFKSFIRIECPDKNGAVIHVDVLTDYNINKVISLPKKSETICVTDYRDKVESGKCYDTHFRLWIKNKNNEDLYQDVLFLKQLEFKNQQQLINRLHDRIKTFCDCFDYEVCEIDDIFISYNAKPVRISRLRVEAVVTIN